MRKVQHSIIALILCLQTICQSIISTLGQYIYASYLQTYPYSTNETHDASLTSNKLQLQFFQSEVSTDFCVSNTTNVSTATGAELWAQEQSADLFFRIDLWNSCPMIIMTYLIGIYTPRLGRHIVLILPMIGMICQLTIWLAVIYGHLNDYWWCIASFLVGFSGSTNIFNFVIFLIITDNTRDNDRSWYFVVFEALTTAVSAAATFTIGYYIAWRGFTDLYWLSLILQFISIIIVLSFIRDHHEISPREDGTSLLRSTSSSHPIRDLYRICSIFNYRHRSCRISLSLILTLLAYMFYLLAYSTYASFLWFLLDSPFCWSSKQVGNYNALVSIICAIFSLLGMKILTLLGANDVFICTFSHLCFASYSLWISFAKHSWQLYVGLTMIPFNDYQNALTLPMISKWLDVHERNNAFTLVTEINTIITTFGNAFFNWVYGKTISQYRNLNLFLAIGFSLMSFVLNLCLLCVRWSITEIDLSESDESQDAPLLGVDQDEVFL